ncbi:carboxymuconolactone decarboxylase family protein [Methanomicrobium antiquum]|uniref:Carboxymuconolactone decarboxylase family protein n=1 Tax=Methanomicrobium antiquum TaxID=487686 RepID=A0AAF0FRT4_9EURY|nr:carboxymuconolactone decarboxylase family protein [Methanomicrobium antiquum]MDD3976766.1 carboxymuconolactone decarboxylase family protein [Methanomicrobium sp.]WFN36871.1 carboxymuconolactone decarboxylase family protein [Methanomicrobium antiquum]
MCEGSMDELGKKIGKVPVIFKELEKTDPLMHEKILAFDHLVWDDGALTRQQKKIIAIAIAAALRDEHAVYAQIAGAKNLGVKKEEIDEGLRVAFLLAGMPAYVYGKTKLEEAYK